MKFLISNQLAFELPLSNVSATNINKSDITVDFRQDEVEDENQFQLVNMKFVVPSDVTFEEDEEERKRKKELAEKRKAEKEEARRQRKAQKMAVDGESENGNDENEESEDEDEEDDEEDTTSSSAAIFHQRILSRADIDRMTGERFVSLSDISCLTPRGSFRVDFYHEGINLHGQSYDYKIAKNAIKEIFLLPPPNEHRVYLILHLKAPISRGNTKYDFIIFFLEREEDHFAIDLTLSEEDIAVNNYGDKIKPHMEGPRFQLLNNLFRALSGKKTIQPAKGFQRLVFGEERVFY